MLPLARTRKVLARVAFVIWVPALLLTGSLLLGRHLLGLPTPGKRDWALTQDVARARGPDDQGNWLALHILFAHCGCSQQVLDTLLARHASPQMAERIVLVAADDAKLGDQARALGYEFETMSTEELAVRYHSEAAPLLVVADPGGRLRYVGGYTDRKRSPLVRTDELLNGALAGSEPQPLPVFGCAVSAKLQRQTNPFGLL